MSVGAKLSWGRLSLELVVIVAGVLIALGFDSWSAARVDRAMETRYLEAFVDDLTADSASMDGFILPSLARKRAALESILPIVRGERMPTDTFAFLTEVSQGGRLGTDVGIMLAGTTTFDEMTFSGNLSIIKSASLRSALIEHYFDMDINKERFAARLSGYPMLVHAYYPAELRSEATADAVRAFDIERAVAFFTSDEFESVLNQEWNYAVFAGPVLEQSAEEISQTLRLVRAELASR